MAEGNYVFSQNPSAVPNVRKKYREEIRYDGKNNIMYDKRVVRGNTYAAQIPTPNQILMVQAEEARKTKVMNKSKVGAIQVLEGPLVEEGRHNMEVQTDEYLEEIDEAVFEQEIGCQTDFVMDMPDPVIKYRKPYGDDKYTFIEKGDLFKFDTAVEPILATLMGKALDHGLGEVLEEEELKVLEEYQSTFERERRAVLAKHAAIEQKAIETHAEEQRGMDEQRRRHAKQEDVAKRVACNAFARNYLADLQNHAFGALESNGVFYDPAEKDVARVFLPWVRDQIQEGLADRGEQRDELDTIIMDAIAIVDRTRDQYKKKKEARLVKEGKEVARRKEEIRAAEKERARLQREAAKAKQDEADD